MKNNIHPESYPACFVDVSTGKKYLSRSTRKGKKTEVINDIEYQIHIRDITGDSHPVYTGITRFVDTAGRIEKFQNKFARKRN